MGNDLINVTQGDNSNANNRWPKATVSQAAEGNYTFVSADKDFKIIKAEDDFHRRMVQGRRGNGGPNKKKGQRQSR